MRSGSAAASDDAISVCTCSKWASTSFNRRSTSTSGLSQAARRSCSGAAVAPLRLVGLVEVQVDRREVGDVDRALLAHPELLVPWIDGVVALGLRCRLRRGVLRIG